MRTLVVIPTFDEADNIEEALRRVRAHVPDADVLVVDDSSPDGTADLAEALAHELGRIDVLRRQGKQGLGTAYVAGFRLGLERGYEILCEIDADLSHDAADLPALVSAAEHGAHLVIGSRYVPGGRVPAWAWQRRTLSRWGNRYAAAALGLAVNDATSGYRVYRAEMLREIDLGHLRADGYGFQIEMTYRVVRAGGKIVEIPITFGDRYQGESKMSRQIVVEALLLVTGWGIRDVLYLRRGRRHR